MKELTLTEYFWDSNTEISFKPQYQEWFNEYGNRDLMEIEIINPKYDEVMSVVVGLEDMVNLHVFLGEKIKIAKDSGFYDDKEEQIC